MAAQPSLDALICSQKRRFRWRWEAEELAERHIDCVKCTSGRRMEAYPCPNSAVNQDHYHVGHGS